MLEIEQKFADADFTAIEKTLVSWGVTTSETHEEEDQYLAAPDRDFKTTGEAFRMRRVGKSAFFTYKGPRHPGAVKVRTELELPLPPGDDMPGQYLQLFRHLGYRPVAVVRKRRRQFPLTRDGFDMHVCLDEVAGVGRYAEVEIVAPEDQVERARQVMLETATALGLRQDRVEQRSYLTLVLARQGGEGGKE